MNRMPYVETLIYLRSGKCVSLQFAAKTSPWNFSVCIPQPEQIILTAFMMRPPKLCPIKIIGRRVVCTSVSVEAI